MARRRGQAEAGGRSCLTAGCGRRVRMGEAFCRGCGRSAEAVAFRKELRGVAVHLERATGVESVGAGLAMRRLGLRASRGEFDRVGEAARGALAERAAVEAAVAERVVAAHGAMVRAVVEERDVVRMSAAVVLEAAQARGEGVKRKEGRGTIPLGASARSNGAPASPDAEDVGLNRQRPAEDRLKQGVGLGGAAEGSDVSLRMATLT